MNELKIPGLAAVTVAAGALLMATPRPAHAADEGGSASCYFHIPTCSVVDSSAWFSGCSGN